MQTRLLSTDWMWGKSSPHSQASEDRWCSEYLACEKTFYLLFLIFSSLIFFFFELIAVNALWFFLLSSIFNLWHRRVIKWTHQGTQSAFSLSELLENQSLVWGQVLMWDLNSWPNARGKNVASRPALTLVRRRHLQSFLWVARLLLSVFSPLSAFSYSVPGFPVCNWMLVLRSIFLTVFPFAYCSCFLLAFHFSWVSSFFCSCSFLSFFCIKNSLQGLWLFAHESDLPCIHLGPPWAS